MRRFALLLPLAAVLCLSGACAAQPGGKDKDAEFVDPRDPDTFERQVVPLPGGAKMERLVHLDRPWRMVTQEKLAERVLEDATLDVCFEAKFASFGDGEMKLFKQKQGAITLTDPRLKAYVKDHLKGNDNVWLCGTLRVNPRNARELELIVADVIKRENDLGLFGKKVARLERAGDMAGLKKTGAEIGAHLKSAVVALNERPAFEALQSRAWDAYLALKEKQTALDDADACFELATEYQELRNRTDLHDQWIRKCLRIDPEHPRASVIASNRLLMVKYKGVWITRDDHKAILAEQAKEDARLAAAAEEEEARRLAQRRVAEKDRLKRLTELQRALRTPNGDELEAALRALGEDVRVSPDPEFGRKGIAILANINDPYAIWPGLDSAAKSELGEVRLDAYQALAWRGNEQALRALSDALLRETEPGTAKGGVKALVVRGGRPAVQALVDCLRSEDEKIVAEVVEGLRLITRENLAAKNDWQRWWDENKDRKSLPFDKPEDAKVQ